MIAFFLQKGHTLEEMLSLSTAEKIYYEAAWEEYLNAWEDLNK